MGNLETKEEELEKEEEIRKLVHQCLESRNGTLISGNLEFNRSHLSYLSQILPMNKTLTVLDFEVPETGGYILEEDGAELLSRGLKWNGTITTINLTRNFIREEGCKKLAEVLVKNSSITSLNLTENIIGDRGAHAIADACRKNSVMILKLSRNALSSEGVTHIAKIIRSKHKPRPLTVLDLSHNSIDSLGARPLSNSLRYSTHLKSLDLFGNSLESDGIVILADALVMNTSLTELNVGCNMMEEDGALALAEAISHSQSLVTLLVKDNPLRDGGVISLCKSLQGTRIKYLSFAKAQLSDACVTDLCALLIRSRTLSSFDLSHNHIGDDGVAQLALVLTHQNHTLAVLNISHNPIGERSVSAMLECLKINCSLERLPGFQGTSGFYKIPMALEENRKYKELDYTPLMRAVMSNDEASVRILLQHGHDPSRRNIEGRSSSDMAEVGSSSVIRALLSKTETPQGQATPKATPPEPSDSEQQQPESD